MIEFRWLHDSSGFNATELQWRLIDQWPWPDEWKTVPRVFLPSEQHANGAAENAPISKGDSIA